MKIIITNIIILNILLWISHEILHIFRYKKSIIIASTLGGSIAAIALFSYPIITQQLPAIRHITSNNIYSIIPILLFIALISIIAGHGIKQTNKQTRWTTLIIGPLLYYVGSLSFSTATRTTLGIFIILAFAEEQLKLIGVFNRNNKKLINTSDIIICGIISGLSFAFIENIIVSLSIQHSITRIPLFLLHAVFTAIIAGSIYISQKKQKGSLQNNTITSIIFPVIFSFIFLLHASYNNRINQLSWMIRLIIIVIIYIIYSYIQYQAHSTYIKHS